MTTEYQLTRARARVENPPAAIILADTGVTFAMVSKTRCSAESRADEQTFVIPLSPVVNEVERKRNTGGDVS